MNAKASSCSRWRAARDKVEKVGEVIKGHLRMGLAQWLKSLGSSALLEQPRVCGFGSINAEKSNYIFLTVCLCSLRQGIISALYKGRMST